MLVMKKMPGNSFAPLGFHIRNLQVRVAVVSPPPGFLPVLDCLDRAEVDAGTAEFAVVFPDRLALHHFDIVHRPDGCTGAAGSAFIICNEVFIRVMDLAYETIIHESLHEPGEHRNARPHDKTLVDYHQDLTCTLLCISKKLMSLRAFRWFIDLHKVTPYPDGKYRIEMPPGACKDKVVELMECRNPLSSQGKGSKQ
jgi:hypothetical protein